MPPTPGNINGYEGTYTQGSSKHTVIFGCRQVQCAQGQPPLCGQERIQPQLISLHLQNQPNSEFNLTCRFFLILKTNQKKSEYMQNDQTLPDRPHIATNRRIIVFFATLHFLLSFCSKGMTLMKIQRQNRRAKLYHQNC